MEMPFVTLLIFLIIKMPFDYSHCRGPFRRLGVHFRSWVLLGHFFCFGFLNTNPSIEWETGVLRFSANASLTAFCGCLTERLFPDHSFGLKVAPRLGSSGD